MFYRRPDGTRSVLILNRTSKEYFKKLNKVSRAFLITFYKFFMLL